MLSASLNKIFSSTLLKVLNQVFLLVLFCNVFLFFIFLFFYFFGGGLVALVWGCFFVVFFGGLGLL